MSLEKNLGLLCSVNCSNRHNFANLSLLEESNTACESPLKACAWCPLDFVPCIFSFADSVLYPFALMSLSHEYMLSPVIFFLVNHQTWG